MCKETLFKFKIDKKVNLSIFMFSQKHLSYFIYNQKNFFNF